jgi:hypothetical protein
MEGADDPVAELDLLLQAIRHFQDFQAHFPPNGLDTACVPRHL